MNGDQQETSASPGNAPDAAVLVKEGLEHHRAGHPAKAESCYRRALALEPNHPEALHHLGLLALQAGKHEMALAIFKDALSASPSNPALLNSVAAVLARTNCGDAALEYLQQARRVAPDFAPTYHALGVILQRQGKIAEAEETLRTGLERQPHHPEMLTNLGALYVQQRRDGEALALFDRALQASPRFAPAEINRGALLERQGRKAEAEAAYGRAVEFDPESAQAHINYGRLHRYMLADPAIASLNKLSKRTDFPPAIQAQLHFTLAKALEQVRAYSDSYASYRRGNEVMRRLNVFDRADHAKLIHALETSVEKISEQALASSGPRPLFLVGPSASGKIQVANLLGRHPEVGGGQRSKIPDMVRDALANAGKPTVLPAALAEVNDMAAAALGKRIRAEIRERSPDKRAFVMGLRSHSHLYVGLLARACPEAFFLVSRRDLMDVGFDLFTGTFGPEESYAYDEATIGFYLSGYHRLMNHWRKLFGDRLIDVVYEDFVADPDGTLKSIGERLGLSLPFAPVTPDPNWPEIGRWRRYENHLGDLRAALRV
jgi:tetratricopeptide (TPR) repeat protein